ncbi:hypothetical protein [Hymenobacter sp. YC55]|uniref:hypothetical protein n=1 Tax=Hymenobacter sp. YC55 TaxID=3034019 RepID=UPI0023F6739A|nr:hypothetical protein [Hymenobacter sp. YC55]MDF7813268.1 hypothetical protein [Hymenobacter sp. YC55]
MPTPNMSDEELDELVRRSAEAYPEEIPLGGWLRMEDKLNKAATDQLVRQKVVRLFMLEVALVALLLLLWQGYRMATTGTEVAQQPARTSVPVTKKAITAATPTAPAPTTTPPKPSAGASPLALIAPKAFTSEAADKPTLASATTLTAASSRREAVVRGRASTSTMLLVGAVSTQKRRLLPVADETQRSLTNHTASSLRTEAGEADNHITSNKNTAEANPLLSKEVATAPTTTPATPQRPELAQQPTVPAAVAPTLPAQDTLAQKPAVPTPAPDSTEKKRPERPRPAHRLVVGVMVAPSFSAVRRLETARFGNDLGVTLEYRLTSRLRVRASVIRSVKQYGAASSDYTIPASWPWRQGDYVVNANCRMTEIPLNLRYDAVIRPKYTVFTSVGLSSLLMRYECYDYDYQVNGQPRTAVAEVYNGTNHAFGLLNLSGGVERPLGSRWAVQAEPFLQLPLGGVGAGKVRLTSAGAAFSVKYGLLR